MIKTFQNIRCGRNGPLYNKGGKPTVNTLDAEMWKGKGDQEEYSDAPSRHFCSTQIV